jgi:16S rRNA (uracil1498-N3)-methyltransferase
VEGSLRLFVPPGSCDGGRLELTGEDAERAYLRGARAGEGLVALDDSGWELTVQLEEVGPARCRGTVVGRRLADERRTKISVYQGLLHPSDFRRLLARATALGVVSFVPLMTDGSMLPSLDASGEPEGEAEWPRLVRDAAESAGRGRCPGVGQTMLFDHALDGAMRAGTTFVLHPTGVSLAEATADRPFAISLFCPPPGGFSDEERARAAVRGDAVTFLRPPTGGADPVQPTLAVIEALYAALEPAGR